MPKAAVKRPQNVTTKTSVTKTSNKTTQQKKASVPNKTTRYTKKAVVSKDVKTPVVKTPVVKTPVVKTPVVETPVVETPVVETPVVETPKVETPKVETPKVETPSDSDKPSDETPSPRDTVLVAFDDLVKMLQDEIQRLRNEPIKTKGIKFLRSLNKRVKTLRSQTIRAMKQKQKQKTKIPRKGNNSGFQKPVKISRELAKFAGWPEDELRSRVEVTKYICDYISEHNLQNPNDRRQIKPDAKLQKLLGYNPKTAKQPLRYFSIQTQLKKQNHFPKNE